MSEDLDLYVSTTRSTFLLVIENRTVTEAPPIAHWTIGKDRFDVLKYYDGKPGTYLEFVPKPGSGLGV